MAGHIEISQEVRRLHARYTNEDGTPKRGMGARGPERHNHMTGDEYYEIANALQLAPRIGRMAKNRRRIDEVVAVPRGLLNTVLDELGYLIYCEEHPEVGNLKVSKFSQGEKPRTAESKIQTPRRMVKGGVDGEPDGTGADQTDHPGRD